MLEDIFKESGESINAMIRSGEFEDSEEGEYYKFVAYSLQSKILETKTKKEKVVYRNVVFDRYNRLQLEDEFEEEGFVSCFTDGNHEEYGSVRLEIIIPKGTPYFHFDNIIVLQRGIYKLVDVYDDCYVLEPVRFRRLF